MQTIKKSRLLHLPFHRLPDDLIPLILSKLPTKTLCRFKSVSKPWRSLINDPTFFQTVRSKSPFRWIIDSDKLLHIFTLNDEALLTLTHTYSFDGTIWFAKYCNGLLAFLDESLPSFRTTPEVTEIGIFNPATNEHLLLPATSCNQFDLAFDPNSNTYKVLAWTIFNDSVADFKVYTLQAEGCWREIRKAPDADDLDKGVCVDGIVFWIDAREQKLVTFHLGREEFGVIRLPAVMDMEEMCYSIFAFDGCVCLVEQPMMELEEDKRCHLEIVNVWKLKDVVNNVWVCLMKNVHLDMEGTTLEDFFFGYDTYYPQKAASFASARSGEIMVAASDHESQYLYMYNFLKGDFEFKMFQIVGAKGCSHTLTVYEESWVCLEDFGDLYYGYK